MAALEFAGVFFDAVPEKSESHLCCLHLLRLNCFALLLDLIKCKHNIYKSKVLFDIDFICEYAVFYGKSDRKSLYIGRRSIKNGRAFERSWVSSFASIC